MPRWPWALVFAVGSVLLAILIMFWGATEPEVQLTLLGWLDRVIPFIVGAGAGGTAGAGWAYGGRRFAVDWSWPLAVAVFLAVIAIALMVGQALNGDIRDKLLGYFTSIIPFVVGAGAGTAAGRAMGLRQARRSSAE